VNKIVPGTLQDDRHKVAESSRIFPPRRPPAPAPSRGWVGGLSRMSGRPPRYALTCRYGRPDKPTSQSEVGRSPAKRDLYTMVTSLSDALNIRLAFKRTTFNVCAFCMAARTGSPLLSCQVHFFSIKVLYKSIVRGIKPRLAAPVNI